MLRTEASWQTRVLFLFLTRYSVGAELAAQQPIKISSSACDVTIAIDLVANTLY
jgi:hypothetical protein